MQNQIVLLTNKILKLYNNYEMKLYENSKILLSLTSEYMEGPVLKLSLVQGKDISNSLELNFDNDERPLYEYLSLILIVKASEKNDISIIINDDKLYFDIEEILGFIEKDDNDSIKEIINRKIFSLNRLKSNTISDTMSVLNYYNSTFKKYGGKKKCLKKI
jgi:hypothetical protein